MRSGLLTYKSPVKLFFKWRDYRYLPYERRLAISETAALFGQRPREVQEGLLLNIRRMPITWRNLALRTTYFSKIIRNGSEEITPNQAILEATVNGHGYSRNNNHDISLGLCNRQATRYSTHGLHEYRGKFNPQIVRAIGNLLNLKPGNWILDPFCGSGTTLVEAHHMGMNAVGLDFNPLAVEIANAKVSALKVNTKTLLKTAHQLLSQLERKTFKWKSSSATVTGKFAGSDYLSSWFMPKVLSEISVIVDQILAIRNATIRSIFKIILSDILRDVSLQDPRDLRIRRREAPPEEVSVLALFSESLIKKIMLATKVKPHLQINGAYQKCFLADSKEINPKTLSRMVTKKVPYFDAVITSPPYATALPYIDTQRLSLVALGLLQPHALRVAERQLIGTREISNNERSSLEEQIKSNEAKLPRECIDLCRQLFMMASQENNGFRRKNVPSLVYKYLVEMAEVFDSTRNIIRRDAQFVLIVGRNRTFLSGREILIDTPRLLALIAESKGFIVEQIEDLNVYQRYDMHRNNSVKTEAMVILRKP